MTGLVIFDCDGVLVNSERVANEVLVANLGRHGLTVTIEDSEKMFVGGTMTGVYRTALDMGATLPDDWIPLIYREIFDRLAQGVEPMPGVHDLLDTLEARDIPYCVASNGPVEKMRITLGQTGLWDRFERHMVSAYTHGVAKPDPGLFLQAAVPFGVAPEHCLVIEDSHNGVLAASRAGMRCLALVPAGEAPALTALGAHVIRHMNEVPAHLGR